MSWLRSTGKIAKIIRPSAGGASPSARRTTHRQSHLAPRFRFAAVIPVLPPLAAYRADLAGAPGVAAFGPEDGEWILAAEVLGRRARALREGARDSRDALDASFLALLRRSGAEADADADDGPDDAVARGALAVAERMEEGGALRLAYAMLAGLPDAAPDAAPRLRGLAVAQRARIARKLAELDAADHLYGETARLGRALGDADLVVRAALGRAVVARRRGNYPASRALCHRALVVAERAGLPALAGLAHHGLLIAAGVAGDYDSALQHGWAAFQGVAGDPVREADVLAALGGASSDAGCHAAALRAYLGAAARSPAARLRLPALGGAAVSAAHLGDVRQLEAITREVARDLTRDALPYERAHALVLLAEAWWTHAPEGGGEPYRSRALALAEAHGFHELAHRARNSTAAPPAGRRPPGPIAPGARTVVRALEALDTEADAGHATVGTGH